MPIIQRSPSRMTDYFYYFVIYCDTPESPDNAVRLRGYSESVSGLNLNLKNKGEYQYLDEWLSFSEGIANNYILYTSSTHVDRVFTDYTAGNYFGIIGTLSDGRIAKIAQGFQCFNCNFYRMDVFSAFIINNGARNTKMKIYRKHINEFESPNEATDELVATSTGTVDLTTVDTRYSYYF